MNGIIVKALSGFYYLNGGGNIYECRARGSFRKSGISPLVGDKAEFELSVGTSGVVTEILPRKNALSRPPVANIDKLFIVSAYENPEPNAYVIDKITAIAEYADIEPIIVFNKCDTGDFGSWERVYRHAGFKVYTVSAETGEGLAALKEELKNSVSAFTGNSGVGKSSILNALFGGHILKTGDVSEKLGRGKHTTRHTELFYVGDGGFVADTPGFSSFDYDSSDYAFKENLIYCFRDLKLYADNCRFTSCTHTGDGGCGVIKALQNGEIEKSRIANRMLRRVRDFAQVKADGVITKDVADQALCALEIDHLGLDPIDRRMLGAIIENYGGGPVGLETLAATIGEEAVTLEDVYEPYLMQLGFLTRTPRGRCVTQKAYRHLHLPIPGGMAPERPDPMDQLTL